MIPNNKILTPPITGTGIAWIKAAILPIKEKIIAKTAAPPITYTLNTRVMAKTPIFSPYVVFGVAPKKPERMLAIPSPNNERSSPGSFMRSRPTMLLVTTKWPTCSANTTNKAGIIIKIALILKTGVVI